MRAIWEGGPSSRLTRARPAHASVREARRRSWPSRPRLSAFVLPAHTCIDTQHMRFGHCAAALSHTLRCAISAAARRAR
jgi:hypothetical protein